MYKTRLFLEKYNELNKLITKKYGKKYEGNELDAFTNFQLKKYYEQYFSIQKIYTLINSNDILTVSKFIDVSENIFDDLLEIYEAVIYEKLVIDNCVREKNIISVDINTKVIDGIELMKNKNINSLLITENNKYIGLFRNKTFIEYYQINKELFFDSDLRFNKFRDLLLFENITNIEFIKPSMSIEKLYNKNKHNFTFGGRTSFYLITKDGKSDSQLLGLITPYRISTFLI